MQNSNKWTWCYDTRYDTIKSSTFNTKKNYLVMLKSFTQTKENPFYIIWKGIKGILLSNISPSSRCFYRNITKQAVNEQILCYINKKHPNYMFIDHY